MNQGTFTSFLTYSGEKIFPDSSISESIKEGSCFANEPYMLTLAYSSDEPQVCPPITMSAVCPGTEVSVYKVGYVPVTRTDLDYDEAASEKNGPGLFPDILFKRSAEPHIVKRNDSRLPFYEKDEDNLITATKAFQSLAVIINENGSMLNPGIYPLTITVKSLLDGSVLAEHVFSLKVLNEKLPETDIHYTNWFHYDCLCDIHKVELYSERFFEIFENYLKNATLNGMNMLLTPFFTPPLDTFIGGERTCVQLVDIEKNGDNYKFDFSLAERFVRLAVSCGIKYIEHSHLFTQWGAEHAPNIYATEDGVYKRIFGWDTTASGEEYSHFLDCYIPALTEFMKNMGYEDRLFFHISDEPTKENESTYKKAVDTVSGLLRDYPRGDALEDIVFYEKEFVKTPIVSISKADNFYGKCPEYWLYYTGGYYEGSGLEKCANRLLTSKPYRTRILGLHMYKYKATGFLHWGYNYYYDRMTTGICDPKGDACFYKQLPGAAYLAYPGIDTAHPSLREKYMNEAMCDYRALKALEKHIGYDEVIKLCEDFFSGEITVNTMPESIEQMHKFREMINSEIEQHVRGIK